MRWNVQRIFVPIQRKLFGSVFEVFEVQSDRQADRAIGVHSTTSESSLKKDTTQNRCLAYHAAREHIKPTRQQPAYSPSEPDQLRSVAGWYPLWVIQSAPPAETPSGAFQSECLVELHKTELY